MLESTSSLFSSQDYSTAAEITSLSGRGVGMDVVRNNIDQISGSIDVQSVRGREPEAT